MDTAATFVRMNQTGGSEMSGAQQQVDDPSNRSSTAAQVNWNCPDEQDHMDFMKKTEEQFDIIDINNGEVQGITQSIQKEQVHKTEPKLNTKYKRTSPNKLIKLLPGQHNLINQFSSLNRQLVIKESRINWGDRDRDRTRAEYYGQPPAVSVNQKISQDKLKSRVVLKQQPTSEVTSKMELKQTLNLRSDSPCLMPDRQSANQVVYQAHSQSQQSIHSLSPTIKKNFSSENSHKKHSSQVPKDSCQSDATLLNIPYQHQRDMQSLLLGSEVKKSDLIQDQENQIHQHFMQNQTPELAQNLYNEHDIHQYLSITVQNKSQKVNENNQSPLNVNLSNEQPGDINQSTPYDIPQNSKETEQHFQQQSTKKTKKVSNKRGQITGKKSSVKNKDQMILFEFDISKSAVRHNNYQNYNPKLLKQCPKVQVTNYGRFYHQLYQERSQLSVQKNKPGQTHTSQFINQSCGVSENTVDLNIRRQDQSSFRNKTSDQISKEANAKDIHLNKSIDHKYRSQINFSKITKTSSSNLQKQSYHQENKNINPKPDGFRNTHTFFANQNNCLDNNWSTENILGQRQFIFQETESPS